MVEQQQCPECGREFPSNSPGGLCPDCLFQQGMDGTRGGRPEQAKRSSGSAYSPTVSPPGAFIPPEPETLTNLFPQLEVLELLGHGGMGAVYKARQTRLDRIVALKIIRPEAADDPAFAERFNREARTLAHLNHPNIVAVHDFGEVATPLPSGEERTLFYFLMEFVEGANLRQLMQSGELSPEEALAIVPQICEALQFAHDEGVVHRDVKPENILLDERGRVKIADFGLAKLAARSDVDFTLTGTHQVMGTVHYMAPEQLQGSRGVDHRADIYSLGVVIYEMLTGQLPLGRFEPPSQKVQIDVRLDEVVLRALESEPERRYQRASDVGDELTAISRSPSSDAAATVIESKARPQPSAAGTRRAEQGGRPPRSSETGNAAGAGNVDPAVAEQVKPPACGLIVVGALGCVFAPLLLAGFVYLGLGADLAPMLIGCPVVLLALTAGVLQIVAGLRMMDCRSYNLVLVGAIIAVATGLSNLISLAVGIWALVILSRPEVKQEFDRLASKDAEGGASPPDPNSSPTRKRGTHTTPNSNPTRKRGTNTSPRRKQGKQTTADIDAADAAIRDKLHAPAVCLRVTAILSLIVTLLLSLSWFFGWGLTPFAGVIPSVFGLFLCTPACVAIIIGTFKMQKLESYPLCIAAAVLALIPILGGGCLTLPFGIWALVLLAQTDVRAAFERRKHAEDETPALTDSPDLTPRWTSAYPALIVVGLVIGTLLTLAAGVPGSIELAERGVQPWRFEGLNSSWIFWLPLFVAGAAITTASLLARRRFLESHNVDRLRKAENWGLFAFGLCGILLCVVGALRPVAANPGAVIDGDWLTGCAVIAVAIVTLLLRIASRLLRTNPRDDDVRDDDHPVPQYAWTTTLVLLAIAAVLTAAASPDVRTQSRRWREQLSPELRHTARTIRDWFPGRSVSPKERHFHIEAQHGKVVERIDSKRPPAGSGIDGLKDGVTVVRGGETQVELNFNQWRGDVEVQFSPPAGVHVTPESVKLPRDGDKNPTFTFSADATVKTSSVKRGSIVSRVCRVTAKYAGGTTGRRTFAVHVEPEPQSDRWRIGPDGPELTDLFAARMKLAPVEHEQVNAVLRDVYGKYQKLLDKHTTRKLAEDGSKEITIEPFPDEIRNLETELFNKLDPLLTTDQERLFRDDVDLRKRDKRQPDSRQEQGLFGYGANRMEVRIRKVGDWYHWRIKDDTIDKDWSPDRSPENPEGEYRTPELPEFLRPLEGEKNGA